jgi:hypothetical protein
MFLNIIIYSKLKKIYLFLLWTTSYGEKKKKLVKKKTKSGPSAFCAAKKNF